MTESQSKNKPLQAEQQPQPINVEIQRIYVKEQSCKVPHGNQAFQANGQLETSTEINVNGQSLEKGIFAVTLHITLTAKFEQRTLYQADVMNVAAPTLLYLYIRKVIGDAIYNAGFPPVFLSHIDFSQLYQQRVQTKDTETLEKTKPFAKMQTNTDITVH